MNPKDFLNFLTQRIKRTDEQTYFPNATFANTTIGWGGASFEVVLDDAVFEDEQTRYLVTITQLTRP